MNAPRFQCQLWRIIRKQYSEHIQRYKIYIGKFRDIDVSQAYLVQTWTKRYLQGFKTTECMAQHTRDTFLFLRKRIIITIRTRL